MHWKTLGFRIVTRSAVSMRAAQLHQATDSSAPMVCSGLAPSWLVVQTAVLEQAQLAARYVSSRQTWVPRLSRGNVPSVAC